MYKGFKKSVVVVIVVVIIIVRAMHQVQLWHSVFCLKHHVELQKPPMGGFAISSLAIRQKMYSFQSCPCSESGQPINNPVSR